MLNKKQLIFVIIFLLTIIAFFLRVLPFNYGSFITFGDINLFRQALNLGKAIAEHNFSQLKIPSFYPYFFSYIFLFFFGVFYLIGMLVGLFSSSAEFMKYVILQMDGFFETSRILIAVSGALLVPMVYLTTHRLISAKTEYTEYKEKKWAMVASLLTAILMTFSLLNVHYAKILSVHIPVAFLFFLSFYFYLIFLKKKSFLSYLALGLVIGATAGTLQNGFIAILFLILGHFFLIHEKIKKGKIFDRLKRILSWQFLVSLAAFLLIFAISYPYTILSLKESLNLKEGKFNLTLSGSEIIDRADDLESFRGIGFITELKGLLFYEPGLIIILLFLLGIYFPLWKRKINNKNVGEKYLHYVWGTKGLIIFIILYLFLFGIYSHTRYRTLCPLIPFLCVAVGIIAFKVLNEVSKKYKYWIIGFISLVLIFSMVQSFRLTNLAIKDSTQDLAGKWIKNNINSDEVIALESYSRLRLDPSRKSLEKRIELFGPDSLGQRDQFLLSLDEKDYPKDTLTVFPLFIFKENYDKINEFLKKETDYLILGYSASKPGIDPPQDTIYQISSSLNKQLVQRFIPFKNESSRRISKFPLDIENPIIDLWSYERMGPVIEIYKINH